MKNIFFFLILGNIISYSQAQEKPKLENKPLYEIGFGGFIGSLPDYPASDETKIRSLAVPTFVYRGPTLRNDDDGMRARFLRGDNWRFDLSFGGSLPADADKNKARADMPSLDLLLEIGPRFNYIFYNKNKRRLSLTIPFRFAFSTSGSHTEEQGYRLSPNLFYTFDLHGGNHELYTSITMNYASEKLNDYFYEVAGEYKTSERGRFNSKAGYVGTTASIGYSYRNPAYTSFFGVKLNDYSDSTNAHSDLHRSNMNTTLFMAFNFFFYQSEEKEMRNTP